MSYCRKKKCHVTVPECLVCEDCLPPAERIGGVMCKHEFIESDEDGHFIDDPIDVFGVKPDFEGMGVQQEIGIRLSDEEYNKLLEAMDYGAEWMNENGYRDEEKEYRALIEKIKNYNI